MSSPLYQHRWLIAWTVAVAMFMENLDTTIVSVAIPSIAHSFMIGPVQLKLALTSYLMSLAIFIPISGWMADRFGAKRILILAMIVFLLGSVLCGIANHLGELVLARVIQGVGGAMMVPVGRLIVLRVFPIEERIQAMNIVLIAGFVGPALGPFVGGLLVERLSWPWIFWVNVPVGLFGILIASLFLPKMVVHTQTRLDKVGFILFGFGLATFELALTMLAQGLGSLFWVIFNSTVAVFLLGLYFWHSRKLDHPLLNLSLFKEHTFAVSITGAIPSLMVTASLTFLLALMLQLVWHKTAFDAGLIFLPLALGVMSGKFFLANYTLQKYGYQKVLVINTVCFSASILAIGFAAQLYSWWTLAIVLFIQGVIASQQYTALGSLSFILLKPEKFGPATSLRSTIQQFMGAFGVALSAVLLNGLAFVWKQPVMSLVVFQTVLYILGSLVLLALIPIWKLDKNLKLPTKSG